MSDERQGLPSASAVERYEACPGSWNLSQGEEAIRTADEVEWADTGDRIHAWLEQPDFVDLPPADLESAQNCRAQAERIFATVFEGLIHTFDVEKRIWLTILPDDQRPDAGKLAPWKRGLVKRFSGQSDTSGISQDLSTGLVLDYKPMRREALVSNTNLQLRSLALLRWLKYQRRLKRIYVAIIQPLVGEPELCCYEEEDLLQAEKELIGILERIQKPDAPLNPGPQCRYCPAAVKCPRSKEVLEAVANSKPESADVKMLSALLDLCAIAEPQIKKICSHAKELIKAGQEIPGWKLEPNAPIRKLNDALGVFKKLVEEGKIDRGMFLKECVKVGITDVTEVLQREQNLKAKDAKDLVNALLADFITLEPKEPSLKRIK